MKILLKNINALLPKDEGYEIKRTDILIHDDKIELIGTCNENTDKVINGDRRLVIPGLINSHTHAYMALLRNCEDDVPFEDWLFKGVEPRENKMTPEDAYLGTRLANIEMIKSGTTTYVDMHMHVHENCRAAKNSGMRAVIARGLVGEDSNDEGGIRRLNETKAELERWNDNNMFHFLIAPHAPYSCGAPFLEFLRDEAKRLKLGIHIHLAESEFELNTIREKTGMTVIEYMDSLGLFEVPVLAAHCVYLTPYDIQILKDKNVSVVTNPASNMKLANGFAPIPSLLSNGVNVALGTDGAASNNALNMFREMNLMALIHKGVTKDPVTVSSIQVLKAATQNGAKALGLSDSIGRIAVGMKADLAILCTDCPSMVPANNLISSLVYAANGSEVETVIIDGRIVMENRELKTIDEEKVYFEANKAAKRLSM